MRLLCLLLASGASSALAQPATQGFELERLRLNPAAGHGLLLDSADLLPSSQYRAALILHYEHAPLTAFSGNRRALVAARWTADVTAAFALTDMLEVSAQFPVVLGQPVAASLPAETMPVQAGASLGTAYLQLRVAILEEQREGLFDLSTGLSVGLPFGQSASLTSEGALTAVPTLAAGRTLGRFLRLGASVSALVRPDRMLSTRPREQLGSYVSTAVGLSTLTGRLRGELTGRLDVPLTDSPLSGELDLGGRFQLFAPLELFAVAGPGFGPQPGIPTFRVLVGIALVSLPKPVAAPLALVSEPLVVDADGDGVVDDADDCPDTMGLRERRGCPELDGDGDQILDSEDACPSVAGTAAFGGCPPPDSDGDGVPDASDACPALAGPGSLRGCPDVDGDGLDALDDACPEAAGVTELQGCPDTDSDGDGVVDRLDACVTVRGVRNNQGCPTSEKLLVVLTRAKLVVRDRVYFAVGEATVLKQSSTLLGQIARILREHLEITLLRIEGHTDDRGDRETNLALSRARAQAVLKALVDLGVPAAKLSSEGFGPDHPVESNQSEMGRDANRRVEFVIIAK